jgi:NAD(P)-dependent dehydrogenase (short-subunit alcohol dehydrogenase family)
LARKKRKPEVNERTVLLIGATQGLGLALAEHYLQQGWRVIATTIAPSEGLQGLIGKHGERLTVYLLDITDAAAAAALRDKLDGETLDVLHIVAGILPSEDRPIWEWSGEDILRVLNTNAIGALRLANLVEPLVPAGGSFAFTSSGMGSMTRNVRGTTDLYRVSKAALNMLVRSFGAVHGKDRVVLLICPGWVKTEMGGASATIEVADSVAGIYRLIDGSVPHADGARFFEYTGNAVPW